MIIDFAQLARDYKIPIDDSGTSHHSRAGWIQTHCPFCTDGTNGWHLGFSLETGIFNCWRCGALPSRKVLGLLTNRDAKGLYGKYGIKGRVAPIPKLQPRPARLKLPEDTGPMSPAHVKYLRRRGFDPKTIEKLWQVRGIGKGGGKWAWRILIPLYDAAGNYVSYSGRAIRSTAKVRYRTLEHELALANPKDLLYGEYQVPGDSVIIVEGPLDTWRIGPGAVGLLGSGWTVSQACRLAEFKNRYILFDPDKAGTGHAKSLGQFLLNYPGVTEIIDGLSCDPGSLSESDVLCLRQQLGFS